MPDPPRIVIADDLHGALAAVAAVLAQAGYQVARLGADESIGADVDTASTSPDEADHLTATGPRLVLLDVPERTHAELLQGCATRLLEAISIGEPLPVLLRMIACAV